MALMPFSTADWLNLSRLDYITGAPVVGQQMWWLCNSESDTEFRMQIVTVISSSENGSVISFVSGEVLDLMTEDFQDHITIHNDIVAKSRGEAHLTDVEHRSNDAPDEETSPSRVLQNDPPPPTATAESAAQDGVGVGALANDPPDLESGDGLPPPSAVEQNNPPQQTDSTNSAGDEDGVAANAQAGTAAAVLASMILPPPPPPPFTMPGNANEVTLVQARALMLVAKINEKARKKRERDAEAGLFTDVHELKQKLKVAKVEAQRLKIEKKKTAEMAQSAENTGFNLDEMGFLKRSKPKSTRLDNWQLGNKAARERKDEYIKAATVESLPDVRVRLQNHGWAIMDNMASLFDNNCKPTKEQSDYILNTNDDNKNVIFEGAVLHDNSSVISLETKKDKLGGRARFQLKPAGHSGQWGKKYVDLCKKHRPQLSTIIQGMFEDEDEGDPDNWIMQFNSIVGGVCHQHPHCDSGRVGTYQDLSVFPFVALHGFGLHTFSLWLLPQGLDYGFMHEFKADQIVFMRGDMVHAGVPSTSTRGHMEFFPLPAAGWHRRHPFWMRGDGKESTFPWQHASVPFAYPDVGTPNDLGMMSMTYPVNVTDALQLPLPTDKFVVPKKIRLAMKKRMAVQLQHY